MKKFVLVRFFLPAKICLIRWICSKRWASIQWLSFCHNNKETSSKRYGKLTEVCICSKALPHYSMSAQIMSRFMMFYKQSPMLRVFCIWHEQCRLFVPISVESGLSMNKDIIFKVPYFLLYKLRLVFFNPLCSWYYVQLTYVVD